MRKRQFQVANAKVGKKWKYSRNRKKKKKDHGYSSGPMSE